MGRDRYVARIDAQGTLTLIENVGCDQVVLVLPARAVRGLMNLLRRQVVRDAIEQKQGA